MVVSSCRNASTAHAVDWLRACPAVDESARACSLASVGSPGWLEELIHSPVTVTKVKAAPGRSAFGGLCRRTPPGGRIPWNTGLRAAPFPAATRCAASCRSQTTKLCQLPGKSHEPARQGSLRERASQSSHFEAGSEI